MKVLVFVIIWFCVFGSVYAQTHERRQINSKFLNETREVWIGYPANYDSTKSYPVMYVMDAEWQFDIAYAVMKELAVNDKIPQHIVVGIPKIDYKKRGKNLTFTISEFASNGKPDETAASYFNEENTGGGKVFLQHLTREVVPLIEERTNTNGFDVFIGHSLSGYYGAYILTMETPFNAFQLYDPSIWYNRGDAVKHFRETVSEKTSANVFIASSNTGRDRQQYNIDTQRQFHEALLEKNINSELKVYEEDHGSVRLPALIDGLSKLYKGYSFGYIMPTDTITAADAQEHFKSFSKKVNYDFPCPPDVYRWIGFANYMQGKWTTAIEAFELCPVLYNSDVNMVIEYAECLFQIKSYKPSLEFYEKALALDKSNESVKSKIEELKQLISKN